MQDPIVLFEDSRCPGRQAKTKRSELDLTCAWGEKYAFVKSKLGTGFTVAIIGERGTGKTQMGVELIRDATENRSKARYVTAMGFFLRLKETFKNDSEETELDVVNEFAGPHVLIIDEFLKRGESEWAQNVMFELLNRRYNSGTRDTILIDNVSFKDFINFVGPSLASRMQETGGIIEANWPSYRNQR